ncbi:hypothetical protein [Rathayibacter sp. VKM Ac-2760]|uniref:hypothetical protein n=1 Tax=Rathayibacter sp. VKM Ac-2760 TaxID=2609253 RepID=UPI0013171D3C|nr:hypothetical protein [Rathayibacter sp. VKM Ac-2760]QHC60309.1 hypothetical protein GSU72_18415 [Rathayibacter sp. VKM Ac-2760]
MQDEDDERRDLERALYARPSGDDADESRRREAARRLRAEAPDTATPVATPAPAASEAAARGRRSAPARSPATAASSSVRRS